MSRAAGIAARRELQRNRESKPMSYTDQHVIIKPTIGRRVWYWPSEAEHREHIASLGRTRTEKGFHVNRGQPCDAGIAFVHGDRMVNLTVADHVGEMHRRCSVQLLQDGDEAPPDGAAYAQWMPYQKGQAVKG